MPKQVRVAILMAVMVIFAIVMLDLVRSKVEASGRAFRSAAIQYSTLKRVYSVPACPASQRRYQQGQGPVNTIFTIIYNNLKRKT